MRGYATIHAKLSYGSPPSSAGSDLPGSARTRAGVPKGSSSESKEALTFNMGQSKQHLKQARFYSIQRHGRGRESQRKRMHDISGMCGFVKLKESTWQRMLPTCIDPAGGGRD